MVFYKGLWDESRTVLVDDPRYTYNLVTVVGNRLAYNRQDVDGGNQRLCVRDLDESDPFDIELLVWNEETQEWKDADGLFPEWDPLSGGSRLFYHSNREGYLRVYALDLPTGIETVLSPEGVTAFYPAAYIDRRNQRHLYR